MAIFTTPIRVVTYVGVDYHKKFSQITLGDQNGKVIDSKRVWNEARLIDEYLEPYGPLTIAIESCRGYEWLVDHLKVLGHTVHVANAYQVKLIAQSRCKTDKVDSRILMELLAIGFLPTCYQPTFGERELRERLRWRTQLLRNATRSKLHIHSLLAKENLTYGIEHLFNRAGKEYLETVQLSSPTRQYLLREHLALLEAFESKLHAEDSWIHKLAKCNEQVQRLKAVPGIGDLTALLLLAELGDINRFKRSDQVVGYVGLCPSVHSTAETRRTGPITKQGPALLRWILVQAAWRAVDVAPEFSAVFTRVRRNAGKNGAIIAVARKLLEISFHILKHQAPYNPALVAPRTSSKVVATGLAPTALKPAGSEPAELPSEIERPGTNTTVMPTTSINGSMCPQIGSQLSS
jgi:transposase